MRSTLSPFSMLFVPELRRISRGLIELPHCASQSAFCPASAPPSDYQSLCGSRLLVDTCLTPLSIKGRTGAHYVLSYACFSVVGLVTSNAEISSCWIQRQEGLFYVRTAVIVIVDFDDAVVRSSMLRTYMAILQTPKQVYLCIFSFQ